jgi:hypothetical protein
VLAASNVIFLTMEAASTSKKSVNFCQTTQCNNPEDSHLHSLVEVYGCFRGVYCLHRQGDVEAVSTSDKSVNFYQTTRRNIPKDSHLKIYVCFKYEYAFSLSWVCDMCRFWKPSTGLFVTQRLPIGRRLWCLQWIQLILCSECWNIHYVQIAVYSTKWPSSY